MANKVIGIFEGGGARGIAHVGALAEFEAIEADLSFSAVAGTSAGAIIASLVAAGWKANGLLTVPDDLQRGPIPDDESQISVSGKFACSTFELVPEIDWRRLMRLQALLVFPITIARSIRGNSRSLWRSGGWGKAAICLLSAAGLAAAGLGLWHAPRITAEVLLGLVFAIAVPPLAAIVESHFRGYTRDRGVIDTSTFRRTLNEWLSEGLAAAGKPLPEGVEIVAFEHLDIDAYILAQDVASSQLRVFSKRDTPKTSVAQAVAASIAIPGAFKPVRWWCDESETNRLLVDGGAASVFPAWIAADIVQREDPFSLVLGFRLGAQGDRDVGNLAEYTKSLLRALVFGDDSLSVRGVSWRRDITITTGIEPANLELTSRDKLVMFRDGKAAAKQRLSSLYHPGEKSRISKLVRACKTLLVQRFLGLQNVHLRANLALPLEDGRLRICCPVGFSEDDCDDYLEFEPGKGVAGRCYWQREPVFCDLAKRSGQFSLPEEAGGLDRLRRRLVRDSLRSVLSIPLLPIDGDKPDRSREPVGTLNFDSDENLAGTLADPMVIVAASECADLVYSELSRQL